MPVYNAEKYIYDALQSIVKQTYNNLEIIVIDDASNDDTASIVRSIDDKRIKIVKNKVNLKQSASRNKGLMLAKGKYIANMDADDISLPSRIERQVCFMEKNKDVDVCGTYIKLVGKRKDKIIKYPVSSIELEQMSIYATPFAHPTVMMRKSSIEKYEISYDSLFTYAQDFELWSRLALKGAKYANIPEVLFLYRVSDGQISIKHFSEQQMFKGKIIERNVRLLTKRDIYLNTLTSKEFSVIDVKNNIDIIHNVAIEDKLKKQLIFIILNRASFIGIPLIFLFFKNFYGVLYKKTIIKLLIKILIRYNPASLKCICQ